MCCSRSVAERTPITNTMTSVVVLYLTYSVIKVEVSYNSSQHKTQSVLVDTTKQCAVM